MAKLTCKPHSVLRIHGATVISLAPALPPGSSSLPGAQARRAASRACLALLPVGFAWPLLSPATPVRSYRTVSPSLAPSGAGNLPLCGTMPSGHPAWPLASTVPCGVRTFLVMGTPCRDRPINSATTRVLYHGAGRKTVAPPIAFPSVLAQLAWLHASHLQGHATLPPYTGYCAQSPRCHGGPAQ